MGSISLATHPQIAPLRLKGNATRRPAWTRRAMLGPSHPNAENFSRPLFLEETKRPINLQPRQLPGAECACTRTIILCRNTRESPAPIHSRSHARELLPLHTTHLTSIGPRPIVQRSRCLFQMHPRFHETSHRAALYAGPIRCHAHGLGHCPILRPRVPMQAHRAILMIKSNPVDASPPAWVMDRSVSRETARLEA